jgi:hypothetical protein
VSDPSATSSGSSLAVKIDSEKGHPLAWVLATLTYRLASYWAPLAAGPIAYGLFRIRYRSRRSTPQTAVAGT